MNNIIPTTTMAQSPIKNIAFKALEQLDSKSILALSGMAFVTTIICIAIVSFSGSEMTLSKNGLSISQPTLAA